MRILLYLAILMLSACGVETGDSPEGTSPTDTARIEANKEILERMASPKPSYRDDKFELELNMERTTYKKGEPIEASASVTYVGDQPNITVYGAKSFLVFTIHDGKDFNMDGASTAERAPTEFIQGRTITEPFAKSGGYGEDDPDADYWRAFYNEKELILPPGRYVLEAIVSFDLSEEVTKRSPYYGSVHTTVTVEN
ncbi:hypothetical protein [Paenibacillus sacheonensis]|uniref:DUF4352 domain-containing protein n=1 Tax=Paenibacillus sacheonensis TaxID=742054 RepID=A0A7X5BZ33_9BACL|nr:hypothetical protein [Paenibacillus sacheonensis]MBM7564919.1 hypothetical protein [Paenibacillus sacheonensis]NBC70292.1 hypothetical protein [Paenibacillus sacheonensis]